MAVRRPTAIESEEARARSGQIQQVEEGEVQRPFGTNWKRKRSNIDVCDSEFADVGGDILRQGASSSRLQVRAEKDTCSILFAVTFQAKFAT